MGYYIDIVEPDKSQLEESIDRLGRTIGLLYAESWTKKKSKHYDNRPYELNINSFALTWFDGPLKVFGVFDDNTHAVIGFATGMVFRPMQYKASVFQLQELYTRDDHEMAEALLKHVVSSIRILGCDELWVPDIECAGLDPGSSWKDKGILPTRRFTKV